MCEVSETTEIEIYNVNWDADRDDCECYDKVWEDDFETGLSPSCCGDDPGENYVACTDSSPFQGDCGSDTTACCDASTDCVDQNGNCRASGACYGSSVFSNAYCASGTWQDPDESSAYCPASCGTWISSSSRCCGDDSGEYRIVETRGTDAPSQFDDGTDACCGASTNCVEANTCYINGATYGTVPNKGYCSSGSWVGGDSGQTACDAIVGSGKWAIGGEVAGSACCGDDSGENYRTCTDSSAQGSCGSDTTACCDASTDCVDQNGNCQSSGACHGSSVFGNSYCNAGTWEDPDESSAYCPASCGTWITSSSRCCGDDSGEVPRTRVCTSGCTSDPGDEACCDASTDCVLSGTCYNSGSYACSGDTVLYCNSGSWESRSNRGDTDGDGNKEGCKSGQWVETKITSCSAVYNYDGHPSHYKYWPQYVDCTIYYVNYQTEAQVAQVTSPTSSGEGDYKVTYCQDDDQFTGCTPATIGNRGTCTDGVVKDYGDLEPSSGTTYYDDQYRDCDTGNPYNIRSRDPYDNGNYMRIYYEDIGWSYGKYQICANYTDANGLNSDPYCLEIIDEFEDITMSSLSDNYQRGSQISYSGTITDRYDSSPPQDNFLELDCRIRDDDWYHSVTSDDGLSFSLRGVYSWDNYWAYFFIYEGTSSTSGQSGTITSTITLPNNCYLRDRDGSNDYSFYHHNCGWYHGVDGADKTVWCCPGGSWETSSCTNGDSFAVSGQYGGTITITNAITSSGGTTPNDNSDDIRIYVECPSGTALGDESDPYSISLSGQDYFWVGEVNYGGNSYSAPLPDDDYTANVDLTGTNNNEYSCSLNLVTCGKQKVGVEAKEWTETYGGKWTGAIMVDEITLSNPSVSGSTDVLTPSVDLQYCSHDTRNVQMTCELNDPTPDTTGDYCQYTGAPGTGKSCNINNPSCSGGTNTIYCIANDTTYANIDGTSTTQVSFDPDDASDYCLGCGGSWLASKCCGDDGASDDYENPGAGNSCCINGEVVENNATDTTGKFLCLDGQIYGCISGCGATGEIIDGACTRRDGWYCDDTPTDTWRHQITAGNTPDDCDGVGSEYPYGSGEAATTYDKESCTGNAMWNDYGNGPANQNLGYQCRDYGWNGPYIADCTLSQSDSSDEFMTITAYWEVADEVPDTYSSTGKHRWRIDDDGSGTGTCDYSTNGCYYDTGTVNGCHDVDANESTYGDYYSETIQWSDFATKPTSETTYYLEIGEEECGSAQIDNTEDPNNNEGSCTATATLCVPPGYPASTDTDCCPTGGTTSTYPGKDDDGGNCVKCSGAVQLLGGAGNNACEQKCGADAGCDEVVEGECPSNGYICTTGCAYTDRDNSQSYCEDSTGCTAFRWTGSACCGDDGSETYVDSGNSKFLCYEGTVHSCNSWDTYSWDTDHATCAKIGSYYCTASGWTTTPPSADTCPASCEDSGGVWFGGDGGEACCESGDEFLSEKVVENELKAYFKFDESPGASRVFDGLSGLVGDLKGGTTIVTSTSEVVSGNAISFDGIDGYIEVPNDERIQNYSSFTVSLWFKYNGRGPYNKIYHTLINKNPTGLGYNDPYHMWVHNNTRYFQARVGDGSGEHTLSSDVNVNDGIFHHGVLTYDSSTREYVLYLDGQKVDSWTAGDGWVPAQNDGVLTLGKWDAYNNYFNGNLDEVMIWNRSLSADEVRVLYREFPENVQKDLELYWPLDEGSGSTAGDSSGNGRDGSITGGSWTSGKTGGGLSFNGVDDDYVSVTLNKLSTPFTVSLWAKRMGDVDYSASWAGLLGWRVGTEMVQGVAVRSGDEIIYHDYQGSPANVASGTSMGLNTWYHIAAVHNGTHVRLYVNGELKAEQAQTQSSQSSSELQAGGIVWTSGDNREFNGVIDEVRVYSRALNGSEINYLYGAESWRKYGCDSGQLSECGAGDDCTKSLSESGIIYYCYGEYFKDYRDIVDNCQGACTSQGGTWVGGGGDKNCCINSQEFWCNESTGVDRLCYGGLVYPCDYWCDVFGRVGAYTCTPEADGDCTSSTTCSGDECECYKSEGTSCTWDSECAENNCESYTKETPADPSLGNMSGSLSGKVCCPVGHCAFDRDNDGTVDSCAVNTGGSIDADRDNDLDYCYDGTWKECPDYIAENQKASDCSCLGNGIAVNKSGTWVCRKPPVNLNYDTDISCGTLCDSDSDLTNTELIDASGNCHVFETACSNVMPESWWEGNSSLIVGHVMTNCPCGEAASCNISVESNGQRAAKEFSAPSGQSTTVTLFPNFAYGENNVSIACSCSMLGTVCWDKSPATVSSSASIPATECVAGKSCDLKLNVSNVGGVDTTTRAYLQATRGLQQHMNSSSYLVQGGTYHVFSYTDTYACSWYNATWLTGKASVPVDYVGTVELTDLSYNYTTNRTGELKQCESAADCTLCCSGYWWCWANSSQSSDFTCSGGVCCPAGEHFQKGACCLSSERCCLVDGDCNTGEWCDNYTTGFPEGNFFCREKKELGYSCQQDRECDSGYCGDGICADPEPVTLSEWFECKPYQSNSFCSYQSVSGAYNLDPKGCNSDSDCGSGYYCYLPRHACLECATPNTIYGELNVSDDGLCPSTSCIGHDLDCCSTDSDCSSAEWCDASASCTACSTRSDGVCSSSACIGTDPDCCSSSGDCGEGLSCVSNTCTGNVGQACSGDGQCTGGLKCLGGVCAKQSFIALSPEGSYEADLGEILKLTLIVSDPQNQQDRYKVEVDPGYVPDSAFVRIDGEREEEFEMGKGEVRKFLVTVAAAKVPSINTVIHVSSMTNSYIHDNASISVQVTPVTTANVPSAPVGAWLPVLILGYIIGMVLTGKNL